LTNPIIHRRWRRYERFIVTKGYYKLGAEK
jgi:hypothetical protein